MRLRRHLLKRTPSLSFSLHRRSGSPLAWHGTALSNGAQTCPHLAFPPTCLRQLDAPANDATKASSGRDRNSERATWFPDAPHSTTKAWKWLPTKVSVLPQGLEPSPRGSTARDGSANQTPSTHVKGAPCVNLPTMRSRRATEQACAQFPAQRTALNGQGNALPDCPEGEVPDAGRQLGNRRVAGLQPQGKTLKGEEAGGAEVHNATATSKSGLSGFTAQHVAA